MRTFLPAIMALTLVACSTPTTDSPQFSADELKAEQDAQNKAAAKAPLYFNDRKTYGYKQLEALDDHMKPIAERVRRSASQLCEEMHAGKEQTEDDNCVFNIVMDPHRHTLNAYADGRQAVIFPAMVDFLKNDDQLAFILSHEMGHNVMRHIDKQKDNAQWGAVFGSIGDVAAGMARVNSKGKFSKTGMGAGVLGYSEKFEAEADYVGLYIMARAGYNIDAAPDVWRIMSQAEPNSIYVHLTHPNNPARTIAMTKTVAEIHAKQRAHQPLIPNIQA